VFSNLIHAMLNAEGHGNDGGNDGGGDDGLLLV